VSLRPFLKEIVAAAARAGGREVRLEVSPGLVVPMRPDAMRRTLTNLIDNASRHGACVSLIVRVTPDKVMFLVDDNGPGIEPDRRERVLTAFESSQVNGTGLGLTISRDIVRAHGGELTLEDSPQGGLRVRVTLPR
jgi:two-component system osmolarity sensor histidine kinase EnvZ